MKPMTLTATLALAAALAAAPLLASTDRGAGRGAMWQNLNFAEFDADGDGAVTLEEWRAHVTSRIETRRAERIGTRVATLMEGDADGDGMLSAEELAARMEALAQERREAWGQGRGEGRAEGRGEGRGRGGYSDGSRDMQRGWHHGRHGQRQAMGPRGGDGARMDGEERLVRSFQRIDRDGDGRITEAEFDRAATAMQERMERRAERMERRQERRNRD